MNRNVASKFLVVLYKMSPGESPTICSIADYFATYGNRVGDRCKLVIWDNSPIVSELSICKYERLHSSLSVQYIHTPENRSLSQIYNEVASKVTEDEYLTLLDQDTTLPTSYFEELKMAQIHQWALILPKVECQGVLVSPGSRFFSRGKRLAEISSGAFASKNLLAINSGMSIVGRVFRYYKYDERLRFYGTDTFFMRNYEKYFDLAFVLNTPISHSLAEMEQRSDEQRRAFIEEMVYANKIIFQNSFWEKTFTMIYPLVMRLKFSLGYYK